MPVVITCLETGAFIWLSARVPSHEGPLSRLGEISYSLYLIHVPIGCWLLLSWKVGAWAEVPWLNAVYDAGVTAVCVVAAWGFYRLVERPSIRLGRLRPWQRRAPI